MAQAVRWVGNTVLSATTATIDSFDMTSGANDVIVVRHENGDLQSSAFNVRFGKAKVIRRSDKYVYVEVNGVRATGVVMKLGDSGEAFWVTPGSKDIPQEARCSPISSPIISPRSDGPAPESPLCSSDGGSSLGDRKASNSEITKDDTQQEEGVGELTEDQMMADSDSELVDENAADEMLAENSQIMSQLNKRLHSLVDLSEAELETPTQLVPVQDTKAQPLRLARSAEEDTELPFSEELERPGHQFKLNVWKKIHDNENGTDVFWNMRTNETRHDIPEEYESVSSSDGGEVPNLSSDEEEDGHDEFDDDNFCAKTLYPTKEQLELLNLKDGENEINFVVYTTLRGKQSVTCYAYLWDSTSQLVVSDVDGTITRSDILGHLLPRVGKDWTHKGICSLYNRVVDNGYKLIYLSSRSISQINSTRDYIYSIVQDEQKLPRAPVLVAPDRIFAAFTREVVKRTPHEFKMRMLGTVKMAYPETTEPFYAGFGNRINDAWAYASVGMKEHKIFLIDPSSVIHVFDNRVKMCAYGSLDALCDQAFPPLKDKKATVPMEFNSFNYWCLSPSAGLDESDEDEGKTKSVQDPGSETPKLEVVKPLGLAAAWGKTPPSAPPNPADVEIRSDLRPGGIDGTSSPMRSPPRSPPTSAAHIDPVPPKALPASGGGGWGLSSIFGGSRSRSPDPQQPPSSPVEEQPPNQDEIPEPKEEPQKDES